MQTILTFTVVSDGGFGLDIVGQFTVYGCLFIFTGLCYVAVIFYDMIRINFKELK